MRLSNGVKQSNQIFNIYIQQFRVACSHFVDMVFYKLGHFFVIFFFLTFSFLLIIGLIQQSILLLKVSVCL